MWINSLHPLISLTYEMALSASGWQTYPQIVADEIGVQSIFILSIEKRRQGGRIRLMTSNAPYNDYQLADSSGVTPLSIVSHQAKNHRPLAIRDVESIQNVSDDPFYRSVLYPLKAKELLISRFKRFNCVTGIWGTYSTSMKGATSEHSEILSGLSYHLACALDITCKRDSRDQIDRFGLTPRQRQVAELLLHTTSVDSISAELNISRETVRSHLKAIYAQAGVNSRAELVRLIMSGDQFEDTVD